MFGDLEAFVAGHRPRGEFNADVGEQADDGYRVRVSCPCGAVAEYWVRPAIRGEGSDRLMPAHERELRPLMVPPVYQVAGAIGGGANRAPASVN